MLAQTIPTGTLTGHVTDGKVPLAGVTVTVTSPNLQGARIATSTINGDYILDLLPPGPYAARFEHGGFQTVATSIKVSAAQSSRVDAVMPQGGIAKAVTVTGSYETISTTATAATTHEASLIQSLPVNRDVNSYLDLTPGTVSLGAPFAEQIAGAVPAENLYLIDGVVASELNPGIIPLFIEDAIEEVTASITDVSAEYGRFTGGVVNALTKSGGNEFHASLRLTLTNPKWTAATPLTTERYDHTDRLWEAAFGGFLLRDRLWFFGGGRTAPHTATVLTYPPVSIPIETTSNDARYEGKLTFAITPGHRMVASYINREQTWKPYAFGPVYDLASFNSVAALEDDLTAVNYAGVVSSSFFIEGQYSARNRTFLPVGSNFTDVEQGTPVYDLTAGVFYNSPIWCAVCPDAAERRDNKDAYAKFSAFLSTAHSGSHDLRVGVDAFDDMRRVNNWQSGTGYFVDAVSVNIVGTGTSARYFPVVLPGDSIIEYYPILQITKGNHFKTESAFANDVWRLNERITFNIGVRLDRNDGTDASGTKVVKDSKWSPRLSVAWDPRGDGDTQVTLGYGQYVAAIANGVADSQAKGGQVAQYQLLYEGPPINATGNDVETHEALRQVFAWLESIGGALANPQLWAYAYVPGYQVFIGKDLRSPSTTEWTVGVSKRLGTNGLFRLDYIDRSWTDLYSQRVDTTTGKSADPAGNVYDRIIVANDPHVQRRYQGLLVQADYRLNEHLHLGGSYTLAELVGNDVGYWGANLNGLDYYPEYRQINWYAPKGYLSGDHRHKLDAYASWDAVDTKAVSLNVSVLHQYLSGRPYGAVSGSVLVGPYVANPGYATPPADAAQYFFTRPDAYRTDAVTSTELAATLTLKAGRGIQFYINPQVRNVFNNQAVVNPNTTVYVNANKPRSLAAFNPFAESPKECPQGTICNLADDYNWQKGPKFGKAVQPQDYQTGRTFLLNLGVRF